MPSRGSHHPGSFTPYTHLNSLTYCFIPPSSLWGLGEGKKLKAVKLLALVWFSSLVLCLTVLLASVPTCVNGNSGEHLCSLICWAVSWHALG